MLEKFALLATLLGSCVSFNLEPRLPLYKAGASGSTFGFSVAMHKTTSDPNPTLAQSLLVVGSPTAKALPSQPDTSKPGGIFYCPVTTNPDDCQRVNMDPGKSEKAGNKTGQWLGVSLKSEGPGGYLVTCAHRFARTFFKGQNEIQRLCGKCFLLNGTNSNRLVEISPEDSGNRFIASVCDQETKASLVNYKYTLGYAQIGTSLALGENKYLAGGPGMWAWSGGMVEFVMADLESTALEDLLRTTDMYRTLGCNPGEFKDKRKCDQIPVSRDSYMGMSVATSNKIKPNSDDTVFIAGAPRGNITGAVIMYRRVTARGSASLHPILEDSIPGQEDGSSFGFSLTVTDLNADGLDDLVVGAPQYYQYDNDGRYGGAVYVYINDPNRRFSEITPQILYGPLDSFFGYSIARLGDIDQDGYNDFAVGAPYQKPSGKIHIYRGSKSGIVKAAQTLNGENYTELGDSTAFGISMSGRVDIDNNHYPDLLVGTLADHVILFRSRPVISVESSLDAKPPSIDLRMTDCTYSNGQSTTCFSLKFCFKYNSTHNEYKEELAIDYTLSLDTGRASDVTNARATFFNGSSVVFNTVVLPRPGVNVCPEHSVKTYFSPNAKDRFHPVKINLDFNLEKDKQRLREGKDDEIFNMINDPALNPDFPNKLSTVVNLAHSCGDDACQSDLQVDGSMPSEVIVGETPVVRLILDVSNIGEEAHQAFVTARIPKRVFFLNFTVLESSGADIQCYPQETGGSSFVTCSLGNPYEGNSKDKIGIDLDVGSLNALTTNITVGVTARTTSINPDISPVALVSKVIVEMKMSLTSYAQPQQVRYTNAKIIGESAINYTDVIGPLVEYTFNINNLGDVPANDIQLMVNFPYEITNGKWLLYLVSVSVLTGASTPAGECSDADVNSLHYRLRTGGASRTKRDVKPPEGLRNPTAYAYTSGGLSRSLMKLECGKTARCRKIHCNLASLPPLSSTAVIFKARLWNYTFLEEFKKVDLVKIYTRGRLKTSQSNVRIVGDPLSRKIVTTVDHSFFKEDAVSQFPWWYIVIGIILALLIYIIIIWLLIRCGFFKRRKRYPRQPQQADEHVLIDENNHPENSETTA